MVIFSSCLFYSRDIYLSKAGLLWISQVLLVSKWGQPCHCHCLGVESPYPVIQGLKHLSEQGTRKWGSKRASVDSGALGTGVGEWMKGSEMTSAAPAMQRGLHRSAARSGKRALHRQSSWEVLAQGKTASRAPAAALLECIYNAPAQQAQPLSPPSLSAIPTQLLVAVAAPPGDGMCPYQGYQRSP